MNKRDEQLSALLDDALTKEELSDFLHDLHQNPIEDAEKSLRYKLMGDVIRDDVEASSFMDVSASVHRAIEADNSLEQVNIKPRDSKTGFNLSSWLRPVSGMAIAASVAMVTVVTFRTADETGSVDPANQRRRTQQHSNSIFRHQMLHLLMLTSAGRHVLFRSMINNRVQHCV